MMTGDHENILQIFAQWIYWKYKCDSEFEINLTNQIALIWLRIFSATILSFT